MESKSASKTDRAGDIFFSIFCYFWLFGFWSVFPVSIGLAIYEHYYPETIPSIDAFLLKSGVFLLNVLAIIGSLFIVFFVGSWIFDGMYHWYKFNQSLRKKKSF